MTYDVTATFSEEQVKLDSVSPIDMYVINASISGWEPMYYVDYNQDVYGWSMNATHDLTTTATIYSGLPIKRGEIQTNTQGEISELSINIPNVDRAMESVIQTKDYLRGREVFVISTFTKHLPSGSTSYHLGTSPDHRAVLTEKMFVDSVSSNEQQVTFSLKSKFNIKNTVLPRRTFMRECTWAYLGLYLASECDPHGNINSASYPTCDGTLDSCRKRHNERRFGGFPAIPEKAIII